MSTSATRTRTPGDLVLHPVALSAIAAMVVNDRLLKPRLPDGLGGALAGKLSDLAGLVFFPLLVVAAIEAVRRIARRPRWQLDPRAVAIAAVTTGAALVLIKTWLPAATLYRGAMGLVLWPGQAITALARGAAVPAVGRASLVQDPTDLVTLVALVVPWWISVRVMRSPAAASAQGDDRGA